MKKLFVFAWLSGWIFQAQAVTQLEKGREAIFKMQGCYLVDYVMQKQKA